MQERGAERGRASLACQSRSQETWCGVDKNEAEVYYVVRAAGRPLTGEGLGGDGSALAFLL